MLMHFINIFISGSHIQQIINDSAAEVGSTSPDFWVLVAALKVHVLLLRGYEFFHIFLLV